MPIQVLILDKRHLAESLVRDIGAPATTGLEIRLAPNPDDIETVTARSDVLVLFQIENEPLTFDNSTRGIVVVTAENLSSYNEALEAGADIVVPYSTNASQFIAAILSAHRVFKKRAELTEQHAALQAKAAQDRHINIAVEFMAEQLSVSPIEARNRLRKQAREQRKAMYEVAEVVLAAKKLLSKKP